MQYCWQHMLEQYKEIEREHLRLEAQHRLAEGLSRSELKQETQEADRRRSSLREGQNEGLEEQVDLEMEIEDVVNRYTKCNIDNQPNHLPGLKLRRIFFNRNIRRPLYKCWRLR